MTLPDRSRALSALRLIGRLPSLLLILLVKVYQWMLSPLLGGRCRYTPSCSAYAIESLNKYGALKGGLKAFWRVLRCNPFGGCGHDPP